MYKVFNDIEEYNEYTDNGQRLTSGVLYIIGDGKRLILKTNNIDGEFKVYDMIEPSGNIEITENGEDINIAPYSTATVNVEGSGGNEDLIDLIEKDITTLNIPSGTTKIGDQTFNYYTSLQSVNIPDSVTSIGEHAFNYCTSLTSVTIGSGVTSIGEGAFYGCTGLQSVNIPDSVTSISTYAFGACESLTSVTIGSGVTKIGEGAFYYCKGLTSVTVEATTPPTLGSTAFSETSTKLVIYIPAESLEAYKTATNWSSLASRLQAIK